jgi:hypothetical protein
MIWRRLGKIAARDSQLCRLPFIDASSRCLFVDSVNRDSPASDQQDILHVERWCDIRLPALPSSQRIGR